MKLLSLNIWGGKMVEELLSFIREQAKDVDIFCFQEVFSSPIHKTIGRNAQSDIYEQLARTLSDYQGFYSPSQGRFDYDGPVDYDLEYGLAIFVKKTLPVGKTGEVFVYRYRNARDGEFTTEGKNLQFVTCETKGDKYAVFNLHGLWTKGKGDTPERIEQFTKAREFMERFPGFKKIICGDFNVLPDTQSIAVLSAVGMQNLIMDYKITTTRSKFFDKTYAKFADYIFADPDIKIKKFEAIPVDVSDHLPLKVEFK